MLAAAGAAPNARLASVAGLHFVRLLAPHGVGRYRDAYVAARYALAAPVNEARLDAAARRFLAVMGGRVPDGVRLRADLGTALGRATPALPAEPAIAEADRVAVTEVARAWLACRILLDRGGEPTTPGALGRVLEPGTPLSLFEEEVPRAGARVTRAHQYARWSDGTTHLWVGRRKGPGRGEGWSGLRFDVIEPL